LKIVVGTDLHISFHQLLARDDDFLTTPPNRYDVTRTLIERCPDETAGILKYH
jgi:hypothetical protein